MSDNDWAERIAERDAEITRLRKLVVDIDAAAAAVSRITELSAENGRLNAELAAANERAERARRESTDKAEAIRGLVKGIDGAEYWAPLDAVAYIAKGFLRLRDERDTAQAGWRDTLEVARNFSALIIGLGDTGEDNDYDRWRQTDDRMPALVARFDAQGGGK